MLIRNEMQISTRGRLAEMRSEFQLTMAESPHPHRAGNRNVVTIDFSDKSSANLKSWNHLEMT